MLAGTAAIAANLEESQERNIYYWYYATQLLHNMRNKDWERWNARVREGLISMQAVGKECDRGSWDPSDPQIDRWGAMGGRLYTTSLSLLTLEVYYRYLPLYRDPGEEMPGTDRDPDETKDRRRGQEVSSARMGDSGRGREICRNRSEPPTIPPIIGWNFSPIGQGRGVCGNPSSRSRNHQVRHPALPSARLRHRGSLCDVPKTGSRSRASSILSRIQARTHGQVRELRVELADERVVIEGRARTYYAKQLAQHGAMDVLSGQTIVNRIVVG